jgi:hypothetical protein
MAVYVLMEIACNFIDQDLFFKNILYIKFKYLLKIIYLFKKVVRQDILDLVVNLITLIVP